MNHCRGAQSTNEVRVMVSYILRLHRRQMKALHRDFVSAVSELTDFEQAVAFLRGEIFSFSRFLFLSSTVLFLFSRLFFLSSKNPDVDPTRFSCVSNMRIER